MIYIEDWQLYTIIFLAGAYIVRHEYKHRDICRHLGSIEGWIKKYGYKFEW